MSRAGRIATIDGDVFVCPITVWEITRKVALGKLERPVSPSFSGTLSDWLRQAGYRVLPMSREACAHANVLLMHHKGPMDRMLIAHALGRDMTIVTDDEVFGRYGARTI